MWKKVLLKIVSYSIVFLLLNLCEKALWIRGISAAFLLALLYCRENMLIALPIFVSSAMAITSDLIYLICVAAPALLALLDYLAHLKLKKMFTILEISLITLFSQIPLFIFYTADTMQLVYTIVGVLVAVFVNYAFIVLLYPILVRGFKYRLSKREIFAFCIMLFALSIGLSTLNPLGISVFFAVVPFLFLFIKGLDSSKILIVALSCALGGCVYGLNMQIFILTAILGLACAAVYALNKYISAVVLPLVYVASYYLFVGDVTLYAALPVAVGSLLSIFVPNAFYALSNSYRQSYQERFALRTVVNRDRESICWRLNNIAKAFADMKAILLNEQDNQLNSEKLVEDICLSMCENCKQKEVCRAKMGSPYNSISKLVTSAMENGKATLLDATVSLGDNCVLLPRVIATTNDRVTRFKAAMYKKDGMEQGKKMIITQMGGVANLIEKLAESINTGFTYDTKLETRLIDELGYQNIVASDVIVYGKNKTVDEVTLLVREKDAHRASLAKIISKIMKREMEISKKTRDVNGMVSITLNPSPRYKALFGECALGKQNRCGDTRQAVKISRDKIMFILSDGMGSGHSAYSTANDIIMLIENFYKAGFDHKTILSTIGKLLSLRTKEDFSALDIAIIDTQTGDVDFIKQGGRESYLYDGVNIETVEGGALPIGIIEDADPQIATKIMSPSQLLIMSSDGVAEHLTKDSMAELLRSVGTYNPQHVAEQVVENARRISGSQDDDMTCMVIRLATV
ncbi:MAG: SpoIIE family protein phosphatase [Clostridiales bacterium]|nr:SpoIIE family protein phosphatase [Clostridiales bacterium]